MKITKVSVSVHGTNYWLKNNVSNWLNRMCRIGRAHTIHRGDSLSWPGLSPRDWVRIMTGCHHGGLLYLLISVITTCCRNRQVGEALHISSRPIHQVCEVTEQHRRVSSGIQLCFISLLLLTILLFVLYKSSASLIIWFLGFCWCLRSSSNITLTLLLLISRI